MKLRYLLTAALVGGIISFGWDTVSHRTGILSSLKPQPFKDSTAVVETVKANAPSNGIYWDGRGLFAAVSFERDLRPRFASVVVPMAIQLLIEILVAFLLAWILLRLPVWPAMGTGSLFAVVGLAAGIDLLFPEAIRHGFPINVQLAELADLVIGWFLLGVVIGALRNRIMRVREQ
ncbi:MAG: hypothetical protein A2V98_17735 [Planctomycetes bacterium RBG_16_64_12]|nr:MAG: hypothetical protein A2V98_17735 [Planctomycetes bacterium RBG_16_64_12]